MLGIVAGDPLAYLSQCRLGVWQQRIVWGIDAVELGIGGQDIQRNLFNIGSGLEKLQ